MEKTNTHNKYVGSVACRGSVRTQRKEKAAEQRKDTDGGESKVGPSYRPSSIRRVQPFSFC